MYDYAYGNAYSVTSAQRHAEDTSTRHDADYRRARFSALNWDTVFTVSFFVFTCLQFIVFVAEMLLFLIRIVFKAIIIILVGMLYKNLILSSKGAPKVM